MIHRQVMGKEGMTLSIIAALAMFTVAFFIGDPPVLTGKGGICLPSPNEWGMSAGGGWLLNLVITAGTLIALYFCNKDFSFVQGSDTVLTAMPAIMIASNTLVTDTLGSSGIMAFANILCMILLFGCYRKRNAAQELFVIATILSVGSMIQYAFIFMLPVYLIGAIMLKCFNFKIFVAYLLGIAAPYWIGLGLGIISPDSFAMPSLTSVFEGFPDKSSFFFGLVNISVTALYGLILALNNMVKLYAGNTQRRLYNNVINLLGLVSIACLILDFNNMSTYLVTIYVITGVQLANLFALRNIHRGSLWLLGLGALYVAGFILML